MIRLYRHRSETIFVWSTAALGALIIHVALAALFYHHEGGRGQDPSSHVIMLSLDTLPVSFTDNENIASDGAPSQEISDSLTPSPIEDSDRMEDQTSEEDKSEVASEVQVPLSTEGDKIEKVLVKPALPQPKPKRAPPVQRRAPPPSTNAAAIGNTEMGWLAQVEGRLERQKAYLSARAFSADKGKVQLEFVVSAQGEVVTSHLLGAPTREKLGKLALAALRRVGRFPPPPVTQVGRPIRITLVFE
ncbi:TonB family protein [Bartonella sp. DGB2]|uniref:energy transducer TonB family protein n=1 Tax=Bartonella sp. DGB2 TaxID=3388426 RepID=UPI00398FE394